MQIKYTIIFSFAALAFCQLNAQEIWEVPADQATKLSPFEFSAESQKAGSEIYTINCASCHGIPGKANAVALVPLPAILLQRNFRLTPMERCTTKYAKAEALCHHSKTHSLQTRSGM